MDPKLLALIREREEIRSKERELTIKIKHEKSKPKKDFRSLYLSEKQKNRRLIMTVKLLNLRLIALGANDTGVKVSKGTFNEWKTEVTQLQNKYNDPLFLDHKSYLNDYNDYC